MSGEETLEAEDYSDGGEAEAGAPPKDGCEMGMVPKGEVAEGGDSEAVRKELLIISERQKFAHPTFTTTYIAE